MQKQNFEKQVRKKMDELSFVPSAPVWGKIEGQIKKKHDKRRILYWLLPLLLVSGLGGGLLLNKFEPVLQKPNFASQQKKTHTIDNSGGNNLLPTKQADSGKENISITTSLNQSGTQFISSKQAKQQIRQNIKTNYKKAFSSDINTDTSYTQLFINNETTSIKATRPSFEVSQHSFIRNSIFNSISVTQETIPSVNQSFHPHKKTLLNSKWQFSFIVQGGTSNISSTFARFGTSSQAFMADYLPGNATGTSAALSLSPSVPKSGFAFSTGMNAKKNISQRLGIVTGLHYAYYSNYLQVGTRVFQDTSIARNDASYLETKSFFRNDAQQQHYTNQYHFLQIPLGIEYKVANRLPIYVQSGIKVEQLIGSNALFYNKYAAVYVKDNEMLTKTNLSLYSGFTCQFRSRKAFSFAVGPQVQYGLTNFSKNKSNSMHLYFAGLSAQFFLKK